MNALAIVQRVTHVRWPQPQDNSPKAVADRWEAMYPAYVATRKTEFHNGATAPKAFVS